MLLLLLLIGLVVVAGNVFGDGAGVIGVGLLLVLLIGLFCAAWSKDGKAHGNWVDWWASGGPDERDRGRR